ncbi:U-box domain-containing protein 34 [Ipomoea triloba]|uniref:U-box domain-containing protein 34 n=1 Tax=Ipomoea triloba TaxID=35885 RepID=UPI00125DC336|nr:U-box domain-containing protein 34 [Ipomoea triloba]
MEATADGHGPPPVSALTVAVAVKSVDGRGSQRAVRWAVEKLLPKADRFVLVHVMPSITSVPTPSGERVSVEELEASVVEWYVQDRRAKCEEIFIPFKILSKSKKMETLVLEGDSPATVLLRYVTDSAVSSLVMGSSSPGYFSRKAKGLDVPSAVLKYAPDSCDVFVVSTNRLMAKSLNPLLTSAHSRSSSIAEFSDPDTAALDQGNSSTYFHASQERNYQNLEDTSSTLYSANGSPSYSPEVHEEVGQLRLELQNTLAMYNQACEGLIYAQNMVNLLTSECLEESRRVDAAQKREENLRRLAAEEKEKHLKAEKEVEMARKLLDKETYERRVAELKALKESLEKCSAVDALLSCDGRYRRYTRDEIEVATDCFSESKLIGEGGYGKVYKGNLDHTPVAIKVLHSDASEKTQEFLTEVEVLSQLRHPNIVLLIGASPDSCCLVYEYMENGSLEDHIVQGNGRPMPWFIRFRIIFEVACGLAFLHNSKPEPIIHRDLKPGNILLDKNYTSKIGDVGLAKIVSDVAPENVTEYRNSIIAGTLTYMDPEYQRTGTIRPKSDLYAFGIIVLQLLAAQRPNGLVLKFENAVDSNSISDILDKSVTDWPLIETEELAKLALKCCQLRCRDRPDLDTEVLPILKNLAEFADTSMKAPRDHAHAPSHYYCPILQEVMEDPHIAADGFTYDHTAIKAWLDRHNISPVTKLTLQHKTLTPNHTLRLAIQEWKSSTTSAGG